MQKNSPNNAHNAAPLVVYRASAGSGKTFTLACEYIKLLVAKPDDYKNILAVTFTNKATAEMKERIVSKLFGLASGLSSSDDYLQIVCEGLQMEPKDVRERAQKALRKIVHNYGLFRIQTIDSFFQSVLHNLARELGLTSNFSVNINDTQVEEMAVDELIADLKPDSQLLQWILEYVRTQMDENKSWNVIGKVKEFGRDISKDAYKNNRDELNRVLHEGNDFSSYKSYLYARRETERKKMVVYADRFAALLNENSLDINDLSYKTTGPGGYFLKLNSDAMLDDKIVGTRVLTAMDDPQAWFSKSQLQKKPHLSAVGEALTQLLQEAESVRVPCATTIRSINIILSNLHLLRLINSIDQKVQQINQQHNRFQLSETQNLLNYFVKETDAPFIFEKVGTQVNHVMIDEFQDTSQMQWANFKVLFNECLSRVGSHNLIVGDVKQSIYRWRNGDWRMLNNIQDEFHRKQMRATSLDTNYRSQGNIIRFNNQFFKRAAEIEQQKLSDGHSSEAEQLAKAYADVAQKTRGEKVEGQGLIRIRLLADNKDTLPEGTTMRDKILDAMWDDLSDILSHGTEPQNIAILTRANSEIVAIADYMQRAHPDVPIVSDEAFRLDASPATTILISALRLLLMPDDKATSTTLIKAYRQEVMHDEQFDHAMLMGDDVNTRLLPKEYADNMDALVQMPLYDLVETICRLFQLNTIKGADAYLCTLFDLLDEHIKDVDADIASFVKAWDNTLCSKSIREGDANAIRLMTIHKSKGLEFENVLLPFCDWQLEKSSRLWIPTADRQSDICRLPVVPVTFDTRLQGTIFAADYDEEHFQNIIDNLNMLYVAFTRPRCNLFVLGVRRMTKKSKKDGDEGTPNERYRAALIEQVIENEATINDQGDLIYERGTFSKDEKTKKDEDNILIAPPEDRTLDLCFQPMKAEFKQSNASRKLTGDAAQDAWRRKAARRGNIIHSVLSTIRTLDDVPSALRDLACEGLISSDENGELGSEKIIEEIQESLQNEQAASWFGPQWQVVNERDMLLWDDETQKVKTLRADRVIYNDRETVVIDYKTGLPNDAHKDQVREYMRCLRDIGKQNIRGHVWYILQNKIEDVTL